MPDIITGFLQLLASTLIRYFLLTGLAFAIVYGWLPSILHSSKIQQRTAGRKDCIREIINSSGFRYVYRHGCPGCSIR